MKFISIQGSNCRTVLKSTKLTRLPGAWLFCIICFHSLKVMKVNEEMYEEVLREARVSEIEVIKKIRR